MISLQYQIAIEARFILADDNFLENIGMDAFLNPDFDAAHIVGQVIEGPANSGPIKAVLLNRKPLTEQILPFDNFEMLDDLQTEFLLRATQKQKNAKLLTAPKAVMLNGESTSLQVIKDVRYILTST